MIMLEGNKSALYQWDLNQRVIITEVKENVEVHFSRTDDNDDESLSLLTYEENGKMYANIPNIFLQNRGIIHVYVCICGDNENYTKHNADILVLPREKPADYVYTETEVMTFKSHEERIKRIEDKLKYNPPAGGYKFDDTLKFNDETNTLSVNTVNKVEENNTNPVTSGAVYAEIGNIELLLSIL